MKNDHVIELYADWADDSLGADEQRRVQLHLDSCGQCAGYFDKMSALLDTLAPDALPDLEPDPHLPVRVRAIARERADRDGVVDSLPRHSLPTRRFAGWLRASFAGAMAVLAIAIGIYVGYGAGSAQMGTNELAANTGDASTEAFDEYYSAFSQSYLADGLAEWGDDE